VTSSAQRQCTAKNEIGCEILRNAPPFACGCAATFSPRGVSGKTFFLAYPEEDWQAGGKGSEKPSATAWSL
jgi:hypothetical protein